MEEIKTIFKNPMKLNIACKSKFRKEDIYKCVNIRLECYRSTMKVVNFKWSSKILGIKKGDRPDLVHPLDS